VSPRIAKVSQARQVELLPEVRGRMSEISKGMKKSEVVYFSSKHWKKVREEAELFDVWKKDVLRHTYASWHYAYFKDIDRLAYTMGNSKEILFQNYIRPMTKTEAGKYLDLIL